MVEPVPEMLKLRMSSSPLIEPRVVRPERLTTPPSVAEMMWVCRPPPAPYKKVRTTDASTSATVWALNSVSLRWMFEAE